MNLFKFLSAIFLATQLIACGGGGGAALGVLAGAFNTSSSENYPPIANAGITQNVSLGFVGGLSSKVVTLDGTGSSDPNNEVLTFAWTLLTRPTGSAAVLSGATGPKSTFIADKEGTYIAQLIVKDSGNLVSISPPVTIFASTSNSVPVANAGAKQFVVFGSNSTVTLDGTYSTDADNNQLTYEWTVLKKPSISAATLAGDNKKKARPTFVADVAGDYEFMLVVNDGIDSSLPSTVVVTASVGNRPPEAKPGDAKYVAKNTVVSLDGTNSPDPDFDMLTYKWNWMSFPAGTTAPTLVSAMYADPSTSPKPTFTPTAVGTYVLTLTVYDTKGLFSTASITVTVSDVNNAPVAVAGADQNVLVSTLVRLDGTGSTDADKLETLTYKWFLNKPTGSSAVLSSDTASQPTFTADIAGVYVASLVVTDNNSNKLSSANQSLTRVTAATTINSPPVATAGTSNNVTTATAVTLTGSGTDANSDTLTYRWYLVSKPSGSAATVVTTPSIIRTITVTPDVVGEFVLVLILNDGKVDSNPATYTITRTS